jgi:flagellar hook-length control protein FliK
MVVPIVCQQCKTSFCPSHRAPGQHECASLRGGSAGSKVVSNTAMAAGKGSGKDTGAANKPLLGLKNKIQALKPTSDNSSAVGSTKPSSSSSIPTATQAANTERDSSKGTTSTSKNTSSSSPFNLFDKTDKWVPRPIFARA